MHYDYLFVGGGLASGLCTLALLDAQPEARIAIVERESKLGGNHTWCFHGRDVSPREQRWVEPLVVQRWRGYEVRFPRRTRRVASPYACVTSERLHEVLTGRLATRDGCRLVLGQAAAQVEPDRVTLEGGEQLKASVVVDARGPSLSAHDGAQGFQKFVGLELQVEALASMEHEPILMDACLPQSDGFRFMYVLPLTADRWLFEETFFSDDATLDKEGSRARILQYAEEHGVRVRRVLREERGVLPMPWRAAPAQASTGALLAGYRGGLFHPVTGYSFPLGVRFARALAESHPNPKASTSALSCLLASQRKQQRFLFLLTRMMFSLFEPERRFEVLEHFYRLPEPIIERFYAAELTGLDRTRLFLGAPPRGLSLKRALALGRGLNTEQSP